jgi:hypothetical protein
MKSISRNHVLRGRLGLFAVVTLCAAHVATATGLVSGHYIFRAAYAPVCLNGSYPISLGFVTTDSFLRVATDASGQLSGLIYLSGIKSNFTGTLHMGTDPSTANNIELDGQIMGSNPTGRSGDFYAFLHGRQFQGDAADQNGDTGLTINVSDASPLVVTFDVNLTVNGSQVTGSGTASSCALQTPVTVTGANAATCSLHVVGTNLPQFIWDATGPATSFGFVASWSGHGYGFNPTGAQLPIFAPNAPALTPYAVSRKNHVAPYLHIPAFITCDTPINPGVECRTGGVSGVHQLVIDFPKNVTLNPPSGTPAVRVSSGTGSISGFYVINNEVIVNLTGVTNAQTITVILSQVSDGTNTADVVVPAKFLLGDTNGNGAVNSTDVSQTKLQSGQAVTNTNFRTDINLSGSINATDVSLVKSKTGTALP